MLLMAASPTGVHAYGPESHELHGFVSVDYRSDFRIHEKQAIQLCTSLFSFLERASPA